MRECSVFYSSRVLQLRLLLAVCLLSSTLSKPRDKYRQAIDIDLQTGHVEGTNPYITFIKSPQPSRKDNCDSRALLRIDMNSPFQTVRFVLEYARPRLWTFHVADSISDGYGGGVGNTTSLSTAEAHIMNKQLRVYSNQLEGYHDASINGGLLLKVVNSAIGAVNDSITLSVSDQRLEWQVSGKRKQYIESKYLYRLDPERQPDVEDPSNDRFLYVGLNRVVKGDFRRGSGLCRATVVLISETSKSHFQF